MSKTARSPRKGRPKRNAIGRGFGWAWAFDASWGIERLPRRWILCHWVEPSKERLLTGHKPSPEAIPVAVAIVPRGVLPPRRAKRKRGKR